MNVLAVAQSYFDAWSHRTADGIIAAFTEGERFRIERRLTWNKFPAFNDACL